MGPSLFWLTRPLDSAAAAGRLGRARSPWAFLTSATEWFVLVPLFPFWPPIFTLQQPYRIGFLVHLSSAAIYPLFAWLRWRWSGWFDDPMPICSDEELTAMPGYLTADQMLEARNASNTSFDAVFVRLMSQHHAGAVSMADVKWHSAGDPRLRLRAHAMRHEQQGEVALMNRRLTHHLCHRCFSNFCISFSRSGRLCCSPDQSWRHYRVDQWSSAARCRLRPLLEY
jgi:hypothetical protein